MPFIAKKTRRLLSEGTVCREVGDICYLAYTDILRQWLSNPRWATIHDIRKKLTNLCYKLEKDPRVGVHWPFTDIFVAVELAWEMFFSSYVLMYEGKKRRENGDITQEDIRLNS